MNRPLRPHELREAIATTIQAKVKADDVEDLCDKIGAPAIDEDERTAWDSKPAFVRRRLHDYDVPALVRVAQRLLLELDAPDLEAMIGDVSARGVNGEVMNIIFCLRGSHA